MVTANTGPVRSSCIAPKVRKFFAFLSACGFAISITGYFESFSDANLGTKFQWWIITFSGARMDAIFRWSILLVLMWIALALPIYFLEYPASRKWGFAWKVLENGMPGWVAPCFWLIQLTALAHFVWFAMHSGAGVPEIMDKQYVIEARGKILSTLTQAEYLELHAMEARMCATIMVSMYFSPLTYWWFRRNENTS